MSTPEQDCIVLGNAGQLGQLVLNVIGNAVEAAGPGGRVLPVLSVMASSAILEVRDSGPGPAPEVAARLFEPFVTGKRDGVGLGLAVARQAAEAHGGRITWRREQKQTCFVIELPTVAARDVPSPPVLRGRGAGGEGVEASAPLPPTPLPRSGGEGSATHAAAQEIG